jgi:hypothetical protein
MSAVVARQDIYLHPKRGSPLSLNLVQEKIARRFAEFVNKRNLEAGRKPSASVGVVSL